MPEYPTPNLDNDQVRLVGLPRGTSGVLMLIGLVALAIAVALGWRRDDQLRAFSASYLVNYTFFLSIALGALFFVALQHLVRAGWSVTVRRSAEILATGVVYLAVLFLPILAIMLLGWTSPYFKWLDPQTIADSHLAREKLVYLNLPFFTVRAVFYFLVWGLLARFFFKQSTSQDTSGDPMLTRHMEKAAPVAMILFGLTITFASFDWLMSLEPAWFSTIFGVYFFAGAVVGALAALILLALALQAGGVVRRAITVEHYHDLGKLLLGFVVFWGYIAFSQYMLVWYANIPEETVWYLARQTGPWTWVSVGLLFGHLLIPFLGLLPRVVKRRKMLLGVWATWMLVAHWVDIYWLVMPTFAPRHLPFGLLDICCLAAVGCMFFAGVIRTARRCALIPLKDPRLGESLTFENF
ncbi:MAG: quinol:cytochrome C oxidoreductase [Pirellulales bacterium]|nr:quinol:cytochrome C oxidoreductase [Pirellulales bacterium]